GFRGAVAEDHGARLGVAADDIRFAAGALHLGERPQLLLGGCLEPLAHQVPVDTAVPMHVLLEARPEGGEKLLMLLGQLRPPWEPDSGAPRSRCRSVERRPV